MTLPAITPFVHATAMEENDLHSDDIKLVMLHDNCSQSETVSALRDNSNDLIEVILCLEKEETVMNSDIIETSEKRTLRISPVVDTPEIQSLQCTEDLDTAPDLEKELSKTMTEGFSAALDEVIENFDKSDGISTVIDVHFDKSDESDKNFWDDEYVYGTWTWEKGESNIFMDSIKNRLSFEEVVDDSEYLHDWLDRQGDDWQARLIFYDMDEDPWYTHSGGEESEYVGNIHVCL